MDQPSETVKSKILVVEDDPAMGMMIQDCLEMRDFEVRLKENGQDGYLEFLDFYPDLCVFDVMMPIKDGFSLAREVRAIHPNVPIIFLTAKAMKEDVLEGFKTGADDYVKKPFVMEELILRIQAILQRTQLREAAQPTERRVYRIGRFVFDHFFQRLKMGEKEIRLSSKEADLLKLLCDHKDDLLDREVALKALWGEADFFTGRNMDVYINKLRKHFKADPNVEIINVRGKGHRLYWEEEV